MREDGEETRDGGRGSIGKGKEERRGEDEGEQARASDTERERGKKITFHS